MSPFPACLALGFPAFSHSTGPWASTVPRWLLRGIPGQQTLSPAPSPRSLTVLASVSPLPPPQLLRGLLASFPYSNPRVTPPRALSCLEPKTPARDLRGRASGLAANAIWGFSHVEPEARISTGNPPARVPWRYPPKGTVYPLLWGRRFLFSLHWFEFHAEYRLTPWWQVE